MGSAWPKALILGIASSLFFSVTYVINSAIAQSGGDWLWSASLRYLLMLPVLLVLTALRGGWRPVLEVLRSSPGPWLLWSTVGFGLFYAPLSFASAYAPSWMVAGAFQCTILAGALETSLFRDTDGKRLEIPVRLLPAFLVIILGVFLLQVEYIQRCDLGTTLLFVIPVLLSAFAFPLGNRKTMELCGSRLTTMERVLAMTLCSLPFWLVLAGAALLRGGLPPISQVAQALAVAVFSGLIATMVFFHATQLVCREPQRLAMVESSQCGEVLFSLLGGILLLHDSWPGAAGWLGLVFIISGMIINASLTTNRH